MAARLNNRKPRQAPKASPNPRAVPGDNEAAIEEADRVQMISIIAKLSDADAKIELAKEPLKAAQKHRKTIIGLGKAAGFTAKELEARLAEMGMPTREMAETAVRERKQRRWLGILNDEQSELMLGDKVPQDDKDGAHWAGEGYKAGLRQLSSTPPTECAQMHVQAYMAAHGRGLDEVLKANVPGKARLSVREQAAKDFAEDEPEVDLDAAARKLRNDPKFMDRSAPVDDDDDTVPKMAVLMAIHRTSPSPDLARAIKDRIDAGDSASKEEIDHFEAILTSTADDEVTVIQRMALKIIGDSYSDRDGFEATEEELAAQSTRQAVIGAREGDAGEVV